jgi:hypothetical protein
MKKYLYIISGICIIVCTGCDVFNALFDHVEGTYNRETTGEFNGTIWKRVNEPGWIQFTEMEVTIIGVIRIDYKSYSGTYRSWRYDEKFFESGIRIHDSGKNVTLAIIGSDGLAGYYRVSSTTEMMADIVITDYAINGAIIPGETRYLDIQVSGEHDGIFGMNASLTTTSPYVTIINGNGTIGDLLSGHFKTLTDNTGSGYLSRKDSKWLQEAAQAFQFTVSDDCSIGEEITFTVTYTDSAGNTWINALPLLVTGAVCVSTPKLDGYKTVLVFNYKSRHEFDIRVTNSGSSAVSGLKAVLTTTSPYIGINRSTAAMGTINAGCFKTITDGIYDAGSPSASDAILFNTLSSSQVFVLTIAEDCPSGTEIPFTITFTDSLGKTVGIDRCTMRSSSSFGYQYLNNTL